MTRTEILERLRDSRSEFDAAVRAIPEERLDQPVVGGTHSPKDIVNHVTAYESLIVQRLAASRDGKTTEFDRDRVGWEEFNERVWGESATLPVEEVLQRSWAVFGELLEEIERLADEELERPTCGTANLDPSWLQGRAPWEMIAIDSFEHYPGHFEALRAAANE